MIKIKFDRTKTKKVKVNKNKHSKTSKRIIYFVIAAIFTFTGLAMWVQLKSGTELSPTLITCFYGFCTGELWMLSRIKISKLKNGQKTNEYIQEINEYNNEDDGAQG